MPGVCPVKTLDGLIVALKWWCYTYLVNLLFVESEEVVGFNQGRRRKSIMKPPNLGDIKLKISVP